MDMSVLNNIQLDAKVHSSVNYAKARTAIDAACQCRKERRAARMVVIQFLQGKIEHGRINSTGRVKKTIVFPDQTTAIF